MLGKVTHNFYVIFSSRGNLHEKKLKKNNLINDHSHETKKDFFDTTETKY